jgi:hypothetical protein
MSQLDPQPPATPPAVESAPPLPLAVLTYSGVSAGQRPGILTAIGVLSIALACLSALICLFAGLETLGIFMMVKMAPQMNRTARTFSPSPLTAAQVTTVVTKTQTMVALNPAQTQALRAALQAPNQQLIAPQYLWSPVQSTTQMTGGTVAVRFNGGNAFRGTMLIITSAGRVTTSRTGASGNPFAKFKISTTTLVLVFAEDVASFGLAIYLFVAGILLLSGTPRARRWHLRYAAIKIVLAIFGSIVTCQLVHEFTAGLPLRAGSSGTGVIVFIGALLLLGVLYPIALLLTMHSMGVRRYYAEAR